MKDHIYKFLVITGVLSILPAAVYALTAEQVMALKKAGVTDQTIQMMIQQEMAAKDNGEVMGVKEIRDENGQVVTIYSTGSQSTMPNEAEREKVNKAWNMLQHIIIDGRK
mgnify:CR=1 FL=1